MNDDNGWLSDSSMKLSNLLGKSIEATTSLIEAFEAVKKARASCDKFCHGYQKSEATMKKTISQTIEKGEAIFIAVKTSLYSDGTFWCQVWKQCNVLKTKDIVVDISAKLGWMEKEMTAEKVSSATLNAPIFFFSPQHQLYLRAIIEKSFEDHVVVRLLDFGSTEEVSLNVQFYLLPHSNVKRFPLLCVKGKLCNKEIVFPYEVKWRFKDLTHNQILVAHIVDVMGKEHFFPTYQMEIISLLTDTNISTELLLKLNQEEEDEAQVQNAETRGEQSKPGETVFQKPLPIAATVEAVKQKPKNNQEVQLKNSEHSRRSRSRNNSHSKTDYLREKKRTNSATRANTRSDQKIKFPSRCNSADNLSNLKLSKDISKSTDSVITKHDLPPKPSSKEHRSELTNDTRDDSSNPGLAVNKQTDLMTDVAKSIIDKTAIVEKEITPAVLTEKTMIQSNVDLRVEKPKEESRENQIKEAKGSWMDLVPTDERKKVPQVLPPLQNLFYNSTTLRKEPWWSIELININALLGSQARMLFYFYDVTSKRVLNSFKTGCLEFVQISNDSIFQHIIERFASHTQYFFLRNFNVPRFNSRSSLKSNSFLFGIARLDSDVPNELGQYPVSYLSLSRCISSVVEWEQSQGKPIGAIGINKAKEIVDWFCRTLSSQKRYPMFPEYFPWCSIPPCMDNIKKPAGKKLTRPSKSVSLKSLPTPPSAPLPSYPVQGTSTADKPLESPPMQEVTHQIEEEIWDISDDDQQKLPKISNTKVKAMEEKEGCLEETAAKITTYVGVTMDTGKERKSELSHATNNTEVNCTTDLQPDTSTLCSGYYDKTGMWYPTLVAEVVGQALGDFNQADLNQNYKPSPIQILQRSRIDICNRKDVILNREGSVTEKNTISDSCNINASDSVKINGLLAELQSNGPSLSHLQSNEPSIQLESKELSTRLQSDETSNPQSNGSSIQLQSEKPSAHLQSYERSAEIESNEPSIQLQNNGPSTQSGEMSTKLPSNGPSIQLQHASDLLSLVSVTSDHSGDDEVENAEQRFKRDCQIFGVSTDDFE